MSKMVEISLEEIDWYDEEIERLKGIEHEFRMLQSGASRKHDELEHLNTVVNSLEQELSRYKLALEKCREQRDESMYSAFFGEIRAEFNKEIDEILRG